MLDKGLGQLERLTSGERLLIDRRRRGEVQSTAADRFGVSPSMYGKWERNLVAGVGALVRVDSLEAHERCLLYRRRTGKHQWEVARHLGRCRLWINRMERGDAPCDELIDYWEQ